MNGANFFLLKMSFKLRAPDFSILCVFYRGECVHRHLIPIKCIAVNVDIILS